MAASYGKLTPAHREAIYDLKKKKKTGRVIREALKAGYRPDGEDGPALDPVDISSSECNRIARKLLDERDELYSSKVKDRPPHEGIAILSKRLLIIAERETERLERAERGGRLDANKVGRLAMALVRLHALLERNEGASEDAEAANKGDSPNSDTLSTFADELVGEDAGDAVPVAPPQPPPGTPPAVADQVLTPSGAPVGRPPSNVVAGAQAVPFSPPTTNRP